MLNLLFPFIYAFGKLAAYAIVEYEYAYASGWLAAYALVEYPLDFAWCTECSASHAAYPDAVTNGCGVNDFVFAEVNSYMDDHSSAVSEEYQVPSLAVLVSYRLEGGHLGYIT